VDPDQMRHYFKHWDIQLDEATFQKIHQDLDWDKDGKISYKDF
jgi:Ca2+-binding EF-hand superfamily protein